MTRLGQDDQGTASTVIRDATRAPPQVARACSARRASARNGSMRQSKRRGAGVGHDSHERFCDSTCRLGKQKNQRAVGEGGQSMPGRSSLIAGIIHLCLIPKSDQRCRVKPSLTDGEDPCRRPMSPARGGRKQAELRSDG